MHDFTGQNKLCPDTAYWKYHSVLTQYQSIILTHPLFQSSQLKNFHEKCTMSQHEWGSLYADMSPIVLNKWKMIENSNILAH
jgi:hypothetical protein